jgi:hypothetical protein
VTPPVHREVFETLDRAAPYLTVWLTFFAVLTIIRIVRKPPGVPVPQREGMIASELPGLPLMLLHSVGFVLALLALDPVSILLFLWWGPGYVFVASMLLIRARRKSPPLEWKPFARATSWLCKLSYVVFVAIYISLGLYGLPFVYSAWIMHDQVRLTWLRGNADRTRRVSEDLWIPRILYAALLVIPFVVEIPLRPLAMGLSGVIFVLWVVGIVRVVQWGRFRTRPDPRASDNLRDIVYLLDRPY